MAGIFKFVLCFVLLVTMECRVIKIVDDESNNDIVVKIILKHKNKEHKVKEDKLKELEWDKEKAEAKLKEIMDEIKNEENQKSHNDEVHEEIKSRIDSDLSKNELPDNLDEPDEARDSISDNIIDKEPITSSEYVPKLNTRSGIQVGSCPSGFIRRGPLCLPADK